MECGYLGFSIEWDVPASRPVRGTGNVLGHPDWDASWMFHPNTWDGTILESHETSRRDLNPWSLSPRDNVT